MTFDHYEVSKYIYNLSFCPTDVGRFKFYKLQINFGMHKVCVQDVRDTVVAKPVKLVVQYWI